MKLETVEPGNIDRRWESKACDEIKRKTGVFLDGIRTLKEKARLGDAKARQELLTRFKCRIIN